MEPQPSTTIESEELKAQAVKLFLEALSYKGMELEHMKIIDHNTVRVKTGKKRWVQLTGGGLVGSHIHFVATIDKDGNRVEVEITKAEYNTLHDTFHKRLITILEDLNTQQQESNGN